MGLPALNASGSEGRLSQQAQLELQRGQQPARAQWQRLQQLIHEKPVAAAADAAAAAAVALPPVLRWKARARIASACACTLHEGLACAHAMGMPYT